MVAAPDISASRPTSSPPKRSNTAIVIAAPVPGAGPLDPVAGVPLVLRTLLTLQKEGADRIVLVVADRKDAAPVLRDERLRVPVEVRAGASWGEALFGLEGRAVVAHHHVVVGAGVYKRLFEADLGDALAVLSAPASDPAAPFLAAPELAQLVGDDLAALPDDRARVLEAGAGWWLSAETPEGRRRIVDNLFEACRKPADGMVSRHLNRHISIFVSKRLVDTAITPNAMSVVTFFFAVAAALCVARGGYAWTLFGAFLFQWNSILDGVDGELARTRFQHSKLGQWLDTVSDDVSNVLFYAGLTVGASSLPFGAALVGSGLVAIIANVAMMVVYYSELVALGSGDLNAIAWSFDATPPRTLKERALVFFRYAFKKDFFIFFFLMLATVGVLPYGLPIIAAASLATLGAALVRRLS